MLYPADNSVIPSNASLSVKLGLETPALERTFCVELLSARADDPPQTACGKVEPGIKIELGELELGNYRLCTWLEPLDDDSKACNRFTVANPLAAAKVAVDFEEFDLREGMAQPWLGRRR